jgi:CRP-like cAMP-binding protein
MESIKKFRDLLSLESLHKKDIIAKNGEIPKDFFILKNGIIRSFFTDNKGKEYNRSLYKPISSTGAFSALILNKPSKTTYDCLTDCEVYVGDFKEFKKLIEKDIHIALMYSKILELIFIRMEKRIYELSVLNATERYFRLKKEMPKIDLLIPQYHIASFLNITPVQLSRIRKKLLKPRKLT